MVEKAEYLARENPFIEFRLDYLSRPGTAIQPLKEFLHSYPHVTAIATCRRARNGGKFRGTINSEVEVLLKSAEAGCQLVDLELESASKLRPSDFEKLRERAA